MFSGLREISTYACRRGRVRKREVAFGEVINAHNTDGIYSRCTLN